MDEEEFQIRVQQVVEEIERMQPDIDAEVQEQFGAQGDALSQRQTGTWGNVMAANEKNDVPNVEPGAQQQIANEFEEARATLENDKATFKTERTDFRVNFMIDKIFEGSTDEEKAVAFDAVQQSLAPPAPANEMDNGAGQDDYFNPDDFAYVDEGRREWEKGELTEEFNDGNDPPPPPGGGGIEP